MPKLKQDRIQQSCITLAGRIKDKQYVTGVNNETLAAAARMSVTTLFRRMRNPQDFTMGEVLRIGKVLRFDAEDMTRIMKG